MRGMKHPLTPPPINQPNTSPPLDDSGATHGEHYCDHEQMLTHWYHTCITETAR